MPKHDKGIDKYVANSGAFARPILTRLREIVHAACPQAEESFKWRAPHFGYKGMLCGMVAFKAHCVFGFWKSDLVAKSVGKEGAAAIEKCGRLTSTDDLPSKKILNACIKAAMSLNDNGVKLKRPKKAKRELVVPDDLSRALRMNKKAQATFDGFSSSHKREYVEWITDAKTEPTRLRRLETAVEWMAEGKPRNWKYMNC